MAGKIIIHDVIEQDGEELDFNKAFDIVMGLYGAFGDVKYRFLFAMTKNERRAYRFEVAGDRIEKQEG